jgi:hypothetical protein
MVRSSRAPGFPRSRPRRAGVLWWAAGAALVLGSGAVAAFEAPDAREQGPGVPRHATRPYANPRGGYAFAYPPRWRLEDRGSIATVTSPRREVSVSFGLGGRAGLREASLRFVSEIERAYREVDLIGFQLDLIAGEPAISFAGSAVSDRGVPLRFQAISIAGPRRTYQVSVFASAEADPAGVLPPVQEMVGSFRPV